MHVCMALLQVGVPVAAHSLLSHLQAQARKPGVPRVREWNHCAVLRRYLEQLHTKVIHAFSVECALQCRCVHCSVIATCHRQEHSSNHLGCCGGAVLQYQRQQVEPAALATCATAHRIEAAFGTAYLGASHVYLMAPPVCSVLEGEAGLNMKGTCACDGQPAADHLAAPSRT